MQRIRDLDVDLSSQTQDIIQSFPGTKSPLSKQNMRKPYNWSGTWILEQITRMLGSAIISWNDV